MAKRWYIVHAYSNFEKKVAESIKEQAAQKGLADLFEQVLVPTEEVVEVRRGRKIKTRAPLLPRLRAGEDGTDRPGLPPDQEHPEGHGLPGLGHEADPDLGCRGRAHPEPGGGGRRAAEVHRSPSKSASRCASPTVRSPPSTAWWRKSTKNGRGSRSPCPSSAGRRLSNSNTVRSRSSAEGLAMELYRTRWEALNKPDH